MGPTVALRCASATKDKAIAKILPCGIGIGRISRERMPPRKKAQHGIGKKTAKTPTSPIKRP